MKNWRPEESKDYLGWCLEGKASEYYATVVTQDADIGYMQLMQKLQKRFGYKEIPETAQLKLSSLMQGTEERMEEWADRVFQLALRAYDGLPEQYMLNQAIKRICHGCNDKDAGQFAINQHPENIEEIIDHLKSFQYNHQAIYGRIRKEVREVSLGEEETENSVCSHKGDFIQIRSAKVDVTHRLSKLEDHMGTLTSGMRDIMKKMEALVRERSSSRSPRRQQMRTTSKSPSPSGRRCYQCGGIGHFKNECPSLNLVNKPSRVDKT